MKSKKLEDAFASPYFREKSLKIKSLIFIYTFFISITLVLSIQKVYSIDVTLAWNMPAVEELAGFRAFCHEEGQDYDFNNPAWEGNVSTCTISKLKEGTPYYFVVRAYSATEYESNDSNEICFVSTKNNNKIALIFNKLNGKWEPIYIFFGKLSFKDALFDKIELFFSLKNGDEWELYKK